MAGEGSSFGALERANRRQAAILIGGQILVFALFGFAVDLILHGMFFAGGSLGFPWFAVAAVSSAVIYTLRTYYGGPGMVLGAVAAFPIPDNEPKKKILLDIASEMAVAARLLEPQLYMIDDPAPNALAVGRNPQDSVICVTRGLVDGMDREELQGVIAHEMAHIRSYDAWLATLVTATRLARIGSFPALLYQTLTRGTGVLLSRESEYLADGAAVEFTRNPTGLIRALQQIAKTAAPMKHASPAVAPLFIADPMSSASAGGSRSYQEYLDELTRIRSQADKSEEQREAEATKFATDEYPRNALQQSVSTHPPLADRIARLQQLVKAAEDSKDDGSSDEIAAQRSESARFVTNLSTSDPAMAAKVVESALLATPMGRKMMDEKLGGELSSEGLASVELSSSPRKGTGDLSKGSTGELQLGDAGGLNGAAEGNGHLDPAAKEAVELEAIRKMMAEVLPQTRPNQRGTTSAGAGDKSSSFGVMLVFWLVMAMSAGAIAMVVLAK
jgi:heat shock protein HtpX